jgi:YqjK-like protein
MSSDRQRELAARREALRAESAIQRDFLGRTVEDLESRLAGIDRGIEIARRAVRKPVVLAGAIALIAFIGPRRVLRIAGRSAVLFATGRRVMRLLSHRDQ